MRLIFKPAPILAVMLWLTSALPAHALQLSEVLDRARVTPPDRVPFRELRYNALLKEPMELSGYLEYPQPGQLRKVVLSPFQESMLVDGDQVEISRDGRSRRLSLKNRKPILLMLQSIESLLAGDTEALERYFQLELSGTLENWCLQLTPSSERLARQLEGLTVRGGLDRIDDIRFQMHNGEWQLLQILHDMAPP
jgi:hypothetical protein